MPEAPEGLLIRPMSIHDAAQLRALWTLPGVVWGTNRTSSQSLEQVQARTERLSES